MKKFQRLAAALLALLLTMTFPAAGAEFEQAPEPARLEEATAVDAVDPLTGEGEWTLGGEDAEQVPAAIDDPSAVDAPEETGEPEIVEDRDGIEDTENVEDRDGAEDAEPTEVPENAGATETAEPGDETGDTETVEASETTEAPDATEPTEVRKDGETPEETEAPEPTEVSEPTASPAPTEAPAVSTEAGSDKLALEAAAPVAVKLGVGEKFQIPELEGTETPTYATANKKVATVSAAGLIKGKKRGTTTVTATRGAVTVEYAVQVVKAPKKIKLSKKSATLGYDAAQKLGEPFQLVPKLTAGSSSKITYYGYNRKVVTVSEDGVVTPVGVGTTKVTARTFNKKKASIKIKVLSAPSALALNVPAINISVGATYKLKCTLPKKTASALSYVSDNPGCVTVSAKGVLTGVSEGTAGITVRSFNGVEAYCAVTVLPAPEPIQLAYASLSLGVGEKSGPLLGAADVNAAYGGVTFSSSNKKIATVSKLGVVKAKKRGTVTIKVKGGSGSSGSIKVKVYKAPSKVTLSKKSLTLTQFSGAQLGVSLPKGQVGAVTFSSSKTSVATVTPNGFVTAVGKGTATITAKTYNGKKATCTVKVVATKVEIRMADDIHINTTSFVDFPIEVVLASGEAYAGALKVTIDPSDVAVYENGRLMGLLAGRTAIMTVEAGGVKHTCFITVDGDGATYSVRSIAHRGGAKWPDNTLEAFRNFTSTGADGVELDIRSTSDGVQVVIHDETYVANGVTYNVLSQEFATIRALNPSICTLDEALDVIAATGKEIYMNPKDTALGAECVKAIRDRGLQSRTIYFCNNDELLKEIYAADPTAVIGYSLSSGQTATGDALVKKLSGLHARWIVPHKSLVTQAVVNYWHGKGYRVCVWTVDDKATIRKLCAMGVDSILSNYPEYVVDIRKGG